MNSLAPWVRRLLAVSLLVTILLVVWTACLLPLRKWSANSVEAMNDARFGLERLERAVEVSKLASPERNAEIEQQIAPRLATGANEAEATTYVQSQIDRLIKEQGLALESMQAPAIRKSGVLARMVFDVRASGPERKVISFLAAVESATPMLRIDRLLLKATSNQGPDTANGGDQIAIETSITAFWHPSL